MWQQTLERVDLDGNIPGEKVEKFVKYYGPESYISDKDYIGSKSDEKKLVWVCYIQKKIKGTEVKNMPIKLDAFNQGIEHTGRLQLESAKAKVLELMNKGEAYTVKEVAEALSIDEKKAKRHLGGLVRKKTLQKRLVENTIYFGKVPAAPAAPAE